MSLCRRALSAAHLQQAKYSAELNRNRAAALFYKTNLDNKDIAGSELTETALFFFFAPAPVILFLILLTDKEFNIE